MQDLHSFLPVYAAAVKPGIIIMIVMIVVFIGAMIALSLYGKKLQQKQEESQKQLQAAAQSMKLLVIDKKRMKLKESGLPQMVIDQTPKRYRNQKLPIVKAKAGPKIMSFMCEEGIFDLIPVKKEIRAEVSGIYILSVKGMRGSLEAKKKKLKFSEKIKAGVRDKYMSMTKKK